MTSSVAAKLELSPAGVPLRGACGILIPAYNEVATVAGLIATALAAELGPVLVVDDGSSDATSSAARNAGASVLRLAENAGKGGAVAAGLRALQTEVIVLIDADLVGLAPTHLHALAEPVLRGEADMARGVFVGGRWRTTTAQRLAPQLNGQRAVRRELLLGVPRLSSSRYGLEVYISEAARRERWRTVDVPLLGVSQVMKEEKRGFWRGLAVRLGMYRDILRSYLER